MSTPEQFEQEMIQFGIMAERRAVKAVRNAFLVISRKIISETPADVGTACYNWIASVDVPSNMTREAFAPGKGGSTKSVNVAEAILEAEEVAAEYGGDGQSLFLANNLKYIGFLNAGSSKQAPALFVEEAVAQGEMAAKYVRLLD